MQLYDSHILKFMTLMFFRHTVGYLTVFVHTEI